ncbi:MAG: hypothetical protein M3P14_00225 [Chloroflexota bacterium]|nr:hypothetical protein [Chloroflexota bacterium]
MRPVDSYTIDEAATVLGVRKRRIWELVARGVLAGTPEEGGGMRIFLQGQRAVPAPTEGSGGREPNGNGGSHHQPSFEATPFRELLTEFRNLTERYGQALLALGEARGEVAALRTRVELLEARVDLRLPTGGPPFTWSEAPPEGRAAQAAEPAAPEEPMALEERVAVEDPEAPEEPMVSEEPMVPEEPMARDKLARVQPEQADATAIPSEATRPRRSGSRGRRGRGGTRSAVAGFVEALARADDPTPSTLPGADEAAWAFAELQREVAAEQEITLREEDSTRSQALAEPEAPAELAREELAAEEPDVWSAVDAVAASEAVPDELLSDDALGGLVREPVEKPWLDEEARPAGVEEVVSHEPLPAAAVPPVSYSSEWDEPDWIAEEDILETPDEPVASATTVDAESEPVSPAAIEVQDQEGVAPPGPLEMADEVVPDLGTQAETAPERLEGESEESPQDTYVVRDEPAVELASDLGIEPEQWQAPEDRHPPEAEWSAPAWVEAEESAVGWTEARSIEIEPAETEARSTEIEPAETEPAESEPIEAAFVEDGPLHEETITAAPADAPPVEPRVDLPPWPASEPFVAWSEDEQVQTLSEPEQAPVVAPESEHPAELETPAGTKAAASVEQGLEEELMWLGPGFSEPPRPPGPAAPPATAPAAPPAVPPAADASVAPASPPAAVSPAEDQALSRLAEERGWDDDELLAIRSLLAQPGTRAGLPPTPEVHEPEDEAFDWEQGPAAWSPPSANTSFELPGGLELDEAMTQFSGAAPPPSLVTEGGEESEPAALPESEVSATHAWEPVPDDFEPIAISSGAEPGPPSEAVLEPEPQASPAAEPEAAVPPAWSKAGRGQEWEATSEQPPREPASVTPPPTDSPAEDQPRPEPSSPFAARAQDPDWLRRRRGPAANAYRRLRRLFPG